LRRRKEPSVSSRRRKTGISVRPRTGEEPAAKRGRLVATRRLAGSRLLRKTGTGQEARRRQP
jgi:hypothetical protein